MTPEYSIWTDKNIISPTATTCEKGCVVIDKLLFTVKNRETGVAAL